MENKEGFTLLELLIVVVIIGVLSTLGLVNYNSIREAALDKDAIAALRLICAAQKAHRMDTGSYYPTSGSDSNIATINSNLKVLLPSASNRAWNYRV